jgi:hypothetical protein
MYCYQTPSHTNNKAPERLNKSLGALIKDTEIINKSLVSASARLLDLTAPPLPIYPESLQHLSDRLDWGLDSDGIPHEHDFNCMADFVKLFGLLLYIGATIQLSANS